MILIVDVFLALLLLYLATGIVYSIFFYTLGARKIDEGYSESPWHFKVLILPGVVCLWPFLLIKSFRRS